MSMALGLGYEVMKQHHGFMGMNKTAAQEIPHRHRVLTLLTQSTNQKPRTL